MTGMDYSMLNDGTLFIQEFTSTVHVSQKAFYSEGYFQILTGMLGLIGKWYMDVVNYAI